MRRRLSRNHNVPEGVFAGVARSSLATLEINSDTHRKLYGSQFEVRETGKVAVSLVRPPSNREVLRG